MAQFTYTIYDSNPHWNNAGVWPSHQDVDIEADSADEAAEDVQDELDVHAAGLSAVDGYDVGQTLHALVWDEDGQIVAEPTRVLTEEDLA